MKVTETQKEVIKVDEDNDDDVTDHKQQSEMSSEQAVEPIASVKPTQIPVATARN